jgi:hypothetical protein
MRPYLISRGTSINAPGRYFVGDVSGPTASVLVDARAQSLSVGGAPTPFTVSFAGTDVHVLSVPGTLYSARRFVF